MVLEMYLDGQLLDSTQPSLVLLRTNYSVHLKMLMERLKNKHAAVLARSGQPPVFILSGIPSSINSFKPLEHPKTF
jgi:hypothetical protein